jgi:hypothetical protein
MEVDMKKVLTISTLCVSLSACVGPEAQEPIVSAYNGDSVNIIQPMFAAFSDEQLLAKANSICQRGHKKKAERVSKRSLPDYQGTEYLFLCLS